MMSYGASPSDAQKSDGRRREEQDHENLPPHSGSTFQVLVAEERRLRDVGSWPGFLNPPARSALSGVDTDF
uniref:Uncharacterized protein n=1 Tax=Anguilla anguilla TaxID=7936 RepID=A0A0E9RJ74_ANGAN